jgi:hypothetical protein
MQQFSIEDIKEEIKKLKLEILEKEEIIEELLEIINDNKKEE